MDYEKLGRLNNQLVQEYSDYISMIATGSVAVGDPWIEGRSDRDILLVFGEFPSSKLSFIGQALQGLKFDETYDFTPMPRNAFGQANTKYAFSNRFRSKTLFGRDITIESELPDHETARRVYTEGLQTVRHRLGRYIINSQFPVEKTKKRFWKEFKHTFMHLATRCYVQTEDYPCTRREIAERLSTPEVFTLFDVLHGINNQSKERIVKCAKGVISFLNSCDDLEK